MTTVKYSRFPGNTRHFRKSIVNDGSDEHLKRHKNVLTEKEHKQTTYTAYSEIDGNDGTWASSFSIETFHLTSKTYHTQK
jgi:hypothetical protein